MAMSFAAQSRELVDILQKSKDEREQGFLNEALNFTAKAEAMEAEALHFKTLTSVRKG